MEGAHRPQYQLRRVGKPASIIGVKDIMKLNADVTRFGRHSHNDYYLDSSQLAHFISRWHSEIHRVEQEGDTKYIIRDNSLNGTYVNDVRVRGNSVLKESDIIIFGHTNGKNVKPGQKALQADSEFKFVFEKVPAQLNNSIVNSSFQESSVHNGVSSSHMSPAIPVQAPLAESSNGFVLKDISNTNCSTGAGLVPIDSIITQQAQSEDGNPHTTLPADDGSDEDIFHSDESDEDDEDDDKSTSAITTGSTTILTTASAMRPVHTPPPPSKAELRGSSPTPRRGRPPKSSPKASSQQSASKIPPEPPNSGTAASKRRKKSTPSAPPPAPTTKQKEKEKEKEAIDKKKRKRKGPFQKPAAAGGRRSKRKQVSSSGSPSESHSDSEEESGEEDYSYHYDGDTCEAYDCTRPVSDKVSWVQCDDCDRWYHTCCVGCSFEMVAQDNTQFHCGCK